MRSSLMTFALLNLLRSAPGSAAVATDNKSSVQYQPEDCHAHSITGTRGAEHLVKYCTVPVMYRYSYLFTLPVLYRVFVTRKPFSLRTPL